VHTLTRKTVLGGRYVLDEQIGTGNGTSVWQATDTILERAVAVKVLHAQAAGPGAGERFERGARAAAGLNHPNVVAVYDSGLDHDTLFVVMELLEGEPLGRRVARDGPLPIADAVHVASSVLAALAAIESSGAVHASLSNEHVFVGPARRVRISAVATGDIGAIGDAADDDERDSTRAVGRILYFALTGKEPPPHTHGPASPKAIRARVPRDLDVVVAGSLSPDPEKGFTSVASFHSALSRLRVESDTSSKDAGDQGPAANPSVFRSWMLVPLVMVLVVACVIAAGLALGRLKIGGPLLVETKAEAPVVTPARPARSATAPDDAKPIAIESATAWDPFGDGHENDANAPLAIDQSNATFWKTEDYYSGTLGKPGVGLLLDLGSRQTVSGIRLVTPDPGFRFGVSAGDNPDTLARAGVEANGPFATGSKVTRERLRPITGRYALIWITSIEPLPDGTHGAEIADIQLEGTPSNG
jgi:serine/threonine-protein kinase